VLDQIGGLRWIMEAQGWFGSACAMFMPALAVAQPRRASLATMRLIATGLLVAMSLIFVLLTLAGAGGGWGYARAFAEAAMVGGLADWFAVTALFRHPLGLPIPHTAIIPRSKQRIADALSEFVAVNFLAADVVRERLAGQDLAAALARQLAESTTARRIADGLVDAAPAVSDLLEDEVVGEFLRRQIEQAVSHPSFPAALGRGLKVLTENGRHQRVLDAALGEGFRALEQHEAAIRAQVRERTFWIWRLIALDARAADALIGAIDDTLKAIAANPKHPARQRITDMLNRLAYDLEHSPALRGEIARIAGDVINHPALGAYLLDAWRGLKAELAQDAGAAAATRSALAGAIEEFGRALNEDAAVREALNRRLRSLIVELASRHGRDIATVISETIRHWDSRTIVTKLEQNVGPDLQYIRINGTVIGGLVGLILHQASLMMG
jgi:uncharacterized membrane-anchored protein YjiN (DUF445 family)